MMSFANLCLTTRARGIIFFVIISILLSLFPASFIEGESFTQAPSLKPGKIFPHVLKTAKNAQKKKDTGPMWWERDPPVLALQWLDNKEVSMISTSANANDKVQTTCKT